jgi:hypothetical protein
MTAATRPPTRFAPMTLLTACFALSLVAIGCKDEKKLTPPPPASEYLAQSSGTNVLANLQRAYGKESIAEYTKLFSTDFVFVFNPADPIDPSHIHPSSWALADELSSTAHMFTDSSVFRIELSSYSPGLPERADSLLGPRTWKMRVDQVTLQVLTRKEDGTLLTLLVDEAHEVFFFREDSTKSASDGKPTWFIFRWEDQPISGGKVESKSWGQIKAAFR